MIYTEADIFMFFLEEINFENVEKSFNKIDDKYVRTMFEFISSETVTHGRICSIFISENNVEHPIYLSSRIRSKFLGNEDSNKI